MKENLNHQGLVADTEPKARLYYSPNILTCSCSLETGQYKVDKKLVSLKVQPGDGEACLITKQAATCMCTYIQQITAA